MVACCWGAERMYEDAFAAKNFTHEPVRFNVVQFCCVKAEWAN